MGISPSDQSEEAHPSMMIDGHQNENIMRNKKAVGHLTSYTVTPEPME